MPDMREPWAYIESEARQMENKAKSANAEIIKLQAIAATCEEQARSLRWAIQKQKEADEKRTLQRSV